MATARTWSRGFRALWHWVRFSTGRWLSCERLTPQKQMSGKTVAWIAESLLREAWKSMWSWCWYVAGKSIPYRASMPSQNLVTCHNNRQLIEVHHLQALKPFELWLFLQLSIYHSDSSWQHHHEPKQLWWLWTLSGPLPVPMQEAVWDTDVHVHRQQGRLYLCMYIIGSCNIILSFLFGCCQSFLCLPFLFHCLRIDKTWWLAMQQWLHNIDDHMSLHACA